MSPPVLSSCAIVAQCYGGRRERVLDFAPNPGVVMRRNDRYEVLVKRSAECEVLAQVANDMSIRRKSAELAVEYRVLADRLKQLDLMEEMLSQPGF
jgi:hypothetical protein